MDKKIELRALDGSGSFPAYAAGPDDAKAGIVVIQEIFGINHGIRAMVDGWAAEGFRAIAPDLFWRIEPGLELDADVPEQLQRAFDLYGKFDVNAGIADIEAAIKALRAQGVEKVGVVGYCLGGLLAYLSSARTDSDATVGYYGVGIDQRLGEAHAIANPLLLHVATRDGFVPPAAQQAVRLGLAGNRHVTLYDYDADHAFARHEGSSRVPELAAQADARTRAFFAEHLR